MSWARTLAEALYYHVLSALFFCLGLPNQKVSFFLARFITLSIFVFLEPGVSLDTLKSPRVESKDFYHANRKI